MRTGDGLHVAAIAQAQAFTVGGFHPGRVGVAVVGNGDVLVVAHHAGHGAGPHSLALQLSGREAVNVAQEAQGKRRVLRWRRDEFEQRLGVVSGDPGVRQLGAQRRRVRRFGQLAGGVHAQALALVAAGNAAQDLGLTALKKLLNRVAAGELQHESGSLNETVGAYFGKAANTSAINAQASNWARLKVQPRRTMTAAREGTMATTWPQCPLMDRVSAGKP